MYRERVIPKRINVRIEHVKHSNCRLEFLKRVADNEQMKKAAKEGGERKNLKRFVSLRFFNWIKNLLYCYHKNWRYFFKLKFFVRTICYRDPAWSGNMYTTYISCTAYITIKVSLWWTPYMLFTFWVTVENF